MSDTITKEIAGRLSEIRGKHLRDVQKYSMSEVESQMKKELEEVEVKAAPMNWGAGVGWDWIPEETTIDKLIDMSKDKSTFLPALAPWYLGNSMQESAKVPIAGERWHVKGGTEWNTSSTVYEGTPKRQPVTDKVTVEQKPLVYSAWVSDRLKMFSVVDTMAWIRAGIGEQFLFDIEDAVLNADSSTGTTWNINSDDQLATTTFSDDGALDRRYIFDDGLRKQPLNGTANTDYLAVGSISDMNFIFTLLSMLRSDVKPSDLFIVMDNSLYYTLMKQTDFKDASRNGQNSTIFSGAITNIAWVDLFVSDNMRKTEADGKISGATPANNTKSQIIIAKRNVIQHGFAGPIRYQFVEDIEKGTLLKAVQYFGFANANKKAWITEPSIVAGINAS